MREWAPYREAEKLREQGKLTEAIAVYETFLAGLQSDDARRAIGITGVAKARLKMGSYGDAVREFRRAVEVYEEQLSDTSTSDDDTLPGLDELQREAAREGKARALHDLGYAYMVQGKETRTVDIMTQAVEILTEALDYSKATNNRTVECLCLNDLGLSNRLLGNNDGALKFYDEGLGIAREIGDQGMVRRIQHNGTMARRFQEKERRRREMAEFVSTVPPGRFRLVQLTNALIVGGITYFFTSSAWFAVFAAYFGASLTDGIMMALQKGNRFTSRIIFELFQVVPSVTLCVLAQLVWHTPFVSALAGLLGGSLLGMILTSTVFPEIYREYKISPPLEPRR